VPAAVPVRAAGAPDAARGYVGVLLNAGAGKGGATRAVARVAERLGEAGYRAEVTLGRGEDLVLAARRHLEAGASLLVAGGGDGTVSSIARMAVEADVPLGVLPLGTLNHFARDAGVPLELEAALDVIVEGREARLDLGEVNGFRFVNNVSLGIYPRIVELRERQRRRGMPKWLALLWASMMVLRHSPFVVAHLIIDGRPAVRRTPCVVISNNAYRLAGLRATARETLIGGRLAVREPATGAPSTRLARAPGTGRAERRARGDACDRADGEHPPEAGAGGDRRGAGRLRLAARVPDAPASAPGVRAGRPRGAVVAPAG
jgi:diacylglycerol kinase family enzyme